MGADQGHLLFLAYNAIFVGLMKKLLTAILVFIYFTVSTGFVVSLHYCMDELSSAELGARQDQFCERCGMETDGHCCWDDVKVVKLQFQHTVSEAVQTVFAAPAVIVTTHEFFLAPLELPDTKEYFSDHSPPPDGQDTYLHNRVFRI
jgi:hypothetical protein